MQPKGKNLNNVLLLLIQRESIFWTRKFKLNLCTDTVISGKISCSVPQKLIVISGLCPIHFNVTFAGI